MIQAVKSATWKVFAASMLAGQILSPVLMGAQVRPPFSVEQLLVMVVTGLFVGAWVLFGVWTWRKLARMREDGGQRVYNWGVLAWGVPFWIIMAVQRAADDAGGLGNAISGAFAISLLTHALIGFPPALWGGWFFGRGMTGIFGVPRGDR